MKAATVFAAFLAAATSVVADSCNRGGVYCGSSLLRKGETTARQPCSLQDVDMTIRLTRGHLGNYRDHIILVLQANDQPTDEAHIQNSLFDCVSDGNINFVSFCGNGCGGTDSTDPDYCF